MTLALWKDYVASFLSDALGGLGGAYVTSPAFDHNGHLSASFMLVAQPGLNQEDLASRLVAETTSSCSPLYQLSAFGFSGGLVLATASSGAVVPPASANTTRDWCTAAVTLSFSDNCAGQCNA